MTPTGVHQWLPSGRGWALALATGWILFGVGRFVAADDLVGHLLNGLYALAGVYWASTVLSYRVQADDAGLHVRGASWRTTDVAWADVADIRPRRVWWSRAEMVVVTRGGREVRTGLLAADHEASLVEHWHDRTGRESVPAA